MVLSTVTIKGIRGLRGVTLSPWLSPVKSFHVSLTFGVTVNK